MQTTAFDMPALVRRLEGLADARYRAFHASLVSGLDMPLLGVRVPQLRAVSRELLAGDWRAFLETSRDYPLYEARMLHAYVLGRAKCPVAEKLALVDAFLPHVDNWAVCDGLCASLKPKAAEMGEVFDFACACAESDVEFRKRFGLVMLMSCFHEPPFAGRVMEIYRRFSHPGYYARMGAAWGLATLFLSQREAALDILKSGAWDAFTHNMAIRKLCESYRVSDEDKRMLSGLRRKAEKGHE